MDASVILQEHREFFRLRAVADGVADERGYFSALRKAELERLGFGRAQQLITTLVIPSGPFAVRWSRIRFAPTCHGSTTKVSRENTK
jgi:hypothetical protein